MKPKAARTLHARKLLVAAVGIAGVNYAVACDEIAPSSGNLPSPKLALPTCEEKALDAGTDAEACP